MNVISGLQNYHKFVKHLHAQLKHWPYGSYNFLLQNLCTLATVIHFISTRSDIAMGTVTMLVDAVNCQCGMAGD